MRTQRWGLSVRWTLGRFSQWAAGCCGWRVDATLTTQSCRCTDTCSCCCYFYTCCCCGCCWRIGATKISTWNGSSAKQETQIQWILNINYIFSLPMSMSNLNEMQLSCQPGLHKLNTYRWPIVLSSLQRSYASTLVYPYLFAFHSAQVT